MEIVIPASTLFDTCDLKSPSPLLAGAKSSPHICPVAGIIRGYLRGGFFAILAHKHVSHYSSLNLEAMHGSTFLGINGIVDGDDILGLPRENELEVGQQFPDKEAILFAVKTYSIRRSVKHKVLELNHIKYHSKCKHFENG